MLPICLQSLGRRTLSTCPKASYDALQVHCNDVTSSHLSNLTPKSTSMATLLWNNEHANRCSLDCCKLYNCSPAYVQCYLAADNVPISCTVFDHVEIVTIEVQPVIKTNPAGDLTMAYSTATLLPSSRLQTNQTNG
jgi:hypothetical protein